VAGVSRRSHALRTAEPSARTKRSTPGSPCGGGRAIARPVVAGPGGNRTMPLSATSAYRHPSLGPPPPDATEWVGVRGASAHPAGGPAGGGGVDEGDGEEGSEGDEVEGLSVGDHKHQHQKRASF